MAADSRPRGPRRLPAALRRAVGVALVLALLAAIDAFLVEPRLLLVRADVALPLPARLRIVHLADLHVQADGARWERLTRAVAAARPDLVAISGDLIHDVRDREIAATHAREAAAVLRRLAAVAPLYAVQGHSDYLGEVVAETAEAGVVWLDNEGVRVGREGEVLLLGVSQQVGWDEPPRRARFAPLGPPEGGIAAAPGSRRNAYLSWDPDPASPVARSGPVGWSGYDLLVSMRIDGADTAIGVAAHSTYPLGEDRFVRLARGPARDDDDGSFEIVLNGSRPDGGDLDTDVVPQAGRWYRARLRLREDGTRLRVEARVWPAEAPEPAGWQAWAEDGSVRRAAGGTVALWAWGPGEPRWRDLRVVGSDGAVRLDTPFSGSELPPGWREGTRASRLNLARARSPRGPAPAATVLLTHSPDVVRQASAAGVDLVLAGHTHGGQVRLPLLGALTTRSAIGARYDRGLFRWEAAKGGPDTWLYVNPGLGTSLLPVRFWNPPTWAVIQLGRGS